MPSVGATASAPPGRWLVRGLSAVETAALKLAEMLAAALVLGEALVLGAGVVARYLLHRPLTWSDEVAVTLSLWLAMLGSAVALRRGAHMRLALAVDRLAPPWRGIAEAAALLAALGFLLAMLGPAVSYVEDAAFDISPALRLPNSYRAAAILAGLVLMGLTLLRRLVESTAPRDAAAALLGLMALGLMLVLAQPLLSRVGGGWKLVPFFVVLMPCLVALGLPIAFAFGLSSLIYLATVTDFPLSILANRMDEGMADIILLSIPLFIFLGELIVATGIAKTMIGFIVVLLRPVRNGLLYVVIAGMYLVSGVSGSKSADMAAVAPVLFPELKRQGQDEGDLVALLSASGAMAETIPPSIILIAIGAATGVSIAELFTGGILPAAIGALALAAVVYLRSTKIAPAGRRASGRELMVAFALALPGLALPLAIRSAVVNGVATATEVATIGIAYCVLCGVLLYRRFPLDRLYGMLVNTAALSASILLIIGTATAMAWTLAQSGVSETLGTLMRAVPGGRLGFMAVSIGVFAVLGSILEGFPAIILLGPLLFPIAKGLGIDGVQYAMVAILSMSLGLFAPPLGVGYYMACAIGQVSPDRAVGRIWIYLAALLGAVIVVAAVPWFSVGFLAR